MSRIAREMFYPGGIDAFKKQTVVDKPDEFHPETRLWHLGLSGFTFFNGRKCFATIQYEKYKEKKGPWKDLTSEQFLTRLAVNANTSVEELKTRYLLVPFDPEDTDCTTSESFDSEEEDAKVAALDAENKSLAKLVRKARKKKDRCQAKCARGLARRRKLEAQLRELTDQTPVDKNYSPPPSSDTSDWEPDSNGALSSDPSSEVQETSSGESEPSPELKRAKGKKRKKPGDRNPRASRQGKRAKRAKPAKGENALSVFDFEPNGENDQSPKPKQAKGRKRKNLGEWTPEAARQGKRAKQLKRKIALGNKAKTPGERTPEASGHGKRAKQAKKKDVGKIFNFGDSGEEADGNDGLGEDVFNNYGKGRCVKRRL